MRVTTLCGSLQTGSANEAVLSALEARLTERGVTTRRVEGLESLPPFRSDVEVPPAVLAWAERLGSGDAVVIASPEFAAGPPGSLKNGLDWLVGLSTLYRIPVAVVCAGSTGGAFTIEALVRTLSYQGALTVATLGIGAIRTKLDASGAVIDDATSTSLDHVVDVLLGTDGAKDDRLLELVTPVVSQHGVDPNRFGLG